MTDISISLAGRTFPIGDLTLRQARDLRLGDAGTPLVQGSPDFWKNLYDLCIKTIAVAIRENSPEVTEDELWKLPATEEEMARARRMILEHAGFRSPEPTIAQLRSDIAAKKNELADLEATLLQREGKAKITGEE